MAHTTRTDAAPTVMLVQRHAYDGNRNGDASYIDALCDHLQQRGWRVLMLTTDMRRGRSMPFFRSSFTAGAQAIARGTVEVLGHRVSWSARAWAQAVLRIFGRGLSRKLARDERDAESAWLLRQIARHAPDRVILIYDGCGLGQALRTAGIEHVSIPVFFGHTFQALDGNGVQAIRRTPSAQDIDDLNGASLVGFHSDDDVQEARQLGLRNVHKVGIGVDVASAAQRIRRPEPMTILFVAALAPHNVAALQWLLERVYPRILARLPQARLRIAGSIGRALRSGDLHPSIEVLGFVDDLGAAYDRAAVAIGPMVSGSKGMKVKIAEALAYGCPLVATTVSLDSPDLAWARVSMRLADTPQDFADAVTDVLSSAEEQGRLSAAARRAYEDHVSYRAAYRLLDAHLGPPSMHGTATLQRALP